MKCDLNNRHAALYIPHLHILGESGTYGRGALTIAVALGPASTASTGASPGSVGYGRSP
ncbi:hypothetical protein [Spirillospora sp. NBC_01491]|uniref:hypothetical protein n=1 Tax=Spirillospora sp. NBC_01491 TaxID=2976007 RepID=UPI002E373A52|nr:hypothetical protein [Spirillospora sp. NBC_01491]